MEPRFQLQILSFIHLFFYFFLVVELIANLDCNCIGGVREKFPNVYVLDCDLGTSSV